MNTDQSAVSTSWRTGSRWRRALRHVVLVSLAAAFIFPLFWMVLTSLKPEDEALSFPPVWLPHPVELANYSEALSSEPFVSYFWNTLVYCVTTVVGVLLSSSLVAYGFSRLVWRGRDKLFYLMVSTLLLPSIVTLIPLFILFKDLGWVGTYKPLIVPTFFGSSVFSSFLLRQFFLSIPNELSDAARIDGAGELRIYRAIVLPLSKPALAAVALFQFIYAWNDFLGPLIYINTSNSYPLALGLEEFLSQFLTNWPWLMAAATAVTLPIVVLFFFTQRTFIQGITFTGIKG
jgi:multiple sugar transport system permease protein